MKWKLISVYLLIGIFWSAFALTQQIKMKECCGPNDGAVIAASSLTNAFAWPIAMPYGIYRLATE
ncbi:MAG: hypothetical protein HYS44_03255 [Candidatus Niyogibacteria bacterium]|nr:hypothetical protein [Candidatus Niyogibacteria bacterium]